VRNILLNATKSGSASSNRKPFIGEIKFLVLVIDQRTKKIYSRLKTSRLPHNVTSITTVTSTMIQNTRFPALDARTFSVPAINRQKVRGVSNAIAEVNQYGKSGTGEYNELPTFATS
jgi:hypothetical protein